MMITLNSTLSNGQLQPIPHKGDNPELAGEIMTKEELHKFGLALLIVYLYKQKGNLIKSNRNLGDEYPHLVAKNPKDELLYIWVKTEMYPLLPNPEMIEKHDEIINLANQFNAIPVFGGIRMKCISSEDSCVPVCGGEFIVEFTGFKKF